MAAKAVIFDYGGVLSTTPFLGIGAFEREHGYPAGSIVSLLFGTSPPQGARSPHPRSTTTAERLDEARSAYDAQAEREDLDWHRLETGRITLVEFHTRLQDRAEEVLGGRLDGSFYDRFLDGLFVGIHWTVVDRVRRLRADGYRTAIVTNNVAEWSDCWRTSIPIELFDVVVDSCEVGLRKPDPTIFALVCERLGVEPDEAVFLDDSPGHIAAARQFGLHAVLVTGPDQAVADLDTILAEDGFR